MGRPAAERAIMVDAAQPALHEALGVPLAERFQTLAEHAPGILLTDTGCLGIARPPPSLSRSRSTRDAMPPPGNASIGCLPMACIANSRRGGRTSW